MLSEKSKISGLQKMEGFILPTPNIEKNQPKEGEESIWLRLCLSDPGGTGQIQFSFGWYDNPFNRGE